MRLPLQLIVLMLVMMSNKTIGQDVHEITLLVDTKNSVPEKAYELKAGNKTTVLNSSTQDTFTIFASVGDQIKWKALSSSELDVPVTINHIKYLSGPRIFSSDLIQGKKITQATIIRGGSELYTYQIEFKIGTSAQVHTIISKVRIGD
ncbi:hypothetical protein [Muriicola sp.]|uniref:hypothetical protein n=1 Tax=Muriicola sp. TaxID=2020856 RepID=UPI003C718B24